MKKIYVFFLKNAENYYLKQKTGRALVFINLLTLILATFFLIVTVFTKADDINLIYTAIMIDIIPIVTLVLLKKKNILWAGNFFATANVVVMSYGTAFFILPKLPEINLVQGQYLMLGAISFGLLFSNKRGLIINAILVLAASFIYHYQITNRFGNSALSDVALFNYPFSIFVLTIVLYFGKKFNEEAVLLTENEAADGADDTTASVVRHAPLPLIVAVGNHQHDPHRIKLEHPLKHDREHGASADECVLFGDRMHRAARRSIHARRKTHADPRTRQHDPKSIAHRAPGWK